MEVCHSIRAAVFAHAPKYSADWLHLLFGATLALITYYTGSIWGGILIHFANNAFSVFSEYVSQNGGAFDFINKISDWVYSSNLGFAVAAGVVVLCACLLVLFFFLMRKDAVKKSVYPTLLSIRATLRKVTLTFRFAHGGGRSMRHDIQLCMGDDKMKINVIAIGKIKENILRTQ